MLSFLMYSLTVVMLTFGMGGDVGMGKNVQVTANRTGESHSCVTGTVSQCMMQVNPGTYSVTAMPLSSYPTPPLWHWKCDNKSVSVSQNKAVTLHCWLVLF